MANQIARCSTSVVMEDLKTKGMTASASGMIASPGKNVKAKSSLNRVILGTGWYQLERHVSELAMIHQVPPAYTSQRCHGCGDTRLRNRVTPSKFVCQQCGDESNADMNAAKNILASRMGTRSNGHGVFVNPIIRMNEGLNTMKCPSDGKDHSVKNGDESI